MAKLYWRVKVDGKWTWKSAGTILEYHRDKHDTTVIMRNDGYNPGDSDE